MISTKLFKSLFAISLVTLTCVTIQQAVAKEPIDIVEGQLGSRLYRILS